MQEPQRNGRVTVEEDDSGSSFPPLQTQTTVSAAVYCKNEKFSGEKYLANTAI